MLLFILGFESGPGPLFFVMASQDFPSDLVDQGTSVANILMWSFNILIAFFFPLITDFLGGADIHYSWSIPDSMYDLFWGIYEKGVEIEGIDNNVDVRLTRSSLMRL